MDSGCKICPRTNLHKRIEALESENLFLHTENKRLREALGLTLENVAPGK